MASSSIALRELFNKIEPASLDAYAACAARWDEVAKPLRSLGRLEELLKQIAAITGDPHIDIGKKCVLVFCGDNGVLAQGVAQSGSDVTTVIARSLMAGTASVCVMARACSAEVFPIDMGMVESVPGLTDCRLGNGTADISQGPAMTRETAVQGLLAGIELVRQRGEEGYRIIATGEAGIGNTTTSSAMASVLLGQPVEKMTGRGAGLSNEGLERKRRAIRQAIEVNHPDADDPIDILAKLGGFDIAELCENIDGVVGIDILAKLGGFDIAGMAGAFIGGALSHIPIVIDGFISLVAALCAVRLCPAVREYLLPSHLTAEPAGKQLMQELKLMPVIHGDMRLGEGTGAVALFPLLDLAAAVYHEAATFDSIRLEAYQPWER